MSRSDLYAHETELADWVEMLMQWMSRKQLRKEDTASVFNISAWQDFCREYPSIASDMEVWLEARYDYYIAEDDPEDRAGSPRDE